MMMTMLAEKNVKVERGIIITDDLPSVHIMKHQYGTYPNWLHLCTMNIWRYKFKFSRKMCK